MEHRLFRYRCHCAFLFETIHNPTTLAARLFLAGLARLEPLNFKKFVEELEICGKLWSTCGESLACVSIVYICTAARYSDVAQHTPQLVSSLPPNTSTGEQRMCMVEYVMTCFTAPQQTTCYHHPPSPTALLEEPVNLSKVPDGILGDGVSHSNSVSITSFSHYRQLSPISVSDSTEYSVSMVPTWNPSWFELL